MKNHTQNVMEKLVPDPFLKNENWAYLWINSLRFYTVCFYCMPSWALLKHVETKLQITLFYLILNFFKKLKEVWDRLIFRIIFEENYFSCYILLIHQVSLSGYLYFVYIRKYVYCNCLLTKLWRHEFCS